MKQSRIWLASGCAIATLVAAVPALAQQTPANPPKAGAAADEDNTTLVEQVIVTSERRATNIQDTPLAVTAFTDKARENLGITTVQSLAQFTPGVSYSAAADRPTIRGVGRFNNSHGLNSPVAQYVDGIYVSTTQDAARRPIFVDRIEVVSGPQGSLAGKGSAAGAIYTYLKRPKDHFEAEFGGLASNYERWGLEGTITGPITDSLRYRVNMARYRQEKGFFNNLTDGSTEGTRFGNRTLFDIMLAGNVGDKVDYFFKSSFVDYNESLRDGGSFAPFSIGTNNPCIQSIYSVTGLTPSNVWGLFQPGTQTTCGAFSSAQAVGSAATNFAFIPPVAGNPQAIIAGSGIGVNPPAAFGAGSRRDFVSDYNSTLFISGFYSLTFDATYHAPWMDVKYIVGRSRYHYTQTSDNDTSPVSTFVLPADAGAGQAQWVGMQRAPRLVNANGVNRYEEEPSWYSNELTFTSTWKGPLQGIVGLYQYNQYTKQPTATITYAGFSELQNPYYAPVLYTNPLNGASAPVVQPDLAPVNYLGATAQRGNQLTRQNTWAAFTQWEYKFNDKWSLTAGLRYNSDKENAYEEARLITNNPANGAGANAASTPLWTVQGLTAAFLGNLPGLVGQQFGTINGPFATDISSIAPGFAVVPKSAAVPAGYRVVDPASVGTVIAANPLLPTGATCYIYLRIPACKNPAGGLSDQVYQFGPGVTAVGLDQYGNRTRSEKADFSAVTGGFSLSFKPNEDQLYYIRYARGYRPGGFGSTTAGFLPLNPYSDKETLDSYEVGAKVTLFNRLVLNGDVFMYDYKNMSQPLSRFERCIVPGDISTCTAVSSVINLPTGVNQGFELVSQWYATPDLQFVLNYGYLDAHIKNGLVDDFGFQDTNDPAALLPTAHRFKQITCTTASTTCVANPTAGGATNNTTVSAALPGLLLDPVTRQPQWTQDISGNTLPNSPKHKIAANVNYTFHFAPGNVTTSLSYIWRSSVFSQPDLFEEKVAETPSYSQVDARILFRQKDDDYQIILFGTNIFNQTTYESAGATRRGSGYTATQASACGAASGYQCAQTQVYYPSYVLLPPRAYGIEFLKKFR